LDLIAVSAFIVGLMVFLGAWPAFHFAGIGGVAKQLAEVALITVAAGIAVILIAIPYFREDPWTD
jgi:hypothetical protein